MKEDNKPLIISRRQLLIGSVTVLGGYATASYLPSWAQPADSNPLHTRFMQVSRLLVNHQLNPAIGLHMVKAAAAERPGLAAQLDKILAIATRKQAKAVEDFFEDLPAGPLQDLAYWIIFAWYSGVSSPKHNAQVFTYEEALTFKTTMDVVTIPSYGLSAPNRWSHTTVPLLPMPGF